MRFRISKVIWIPAVALVALSLLWVLLIFRGESLPWWKGNLRTHSLWSDGDQFPEMITDWYKRHGYHFLALSDHDVLAAGNRWVEVRDDPRADEVLASYVNRFGAEWVGLKTRPGGSRMLRLKTLEEYRGLLEEEGRFLIIQAEEITGMFDQVPVHVNATNIRELIQPRTGGSVGFRTSLVSSARAGVTGRAGNRWTRPGSRGHWSRGGTATTSAWSWPSWKVRLPATSSPETRSTSARRSSPRS